MDLFGYLLHGKSNPPPSHRRPIAFSDDDQSMAAVCHDGVQDDFIECMAGVGFDPETEGNRRDDNADDPGHCADLHGAACSCGEKVSAAGGCREALARMMECSIVSNFGCGVGSPCGPGGYAPKDVPQSAAAF